MDNDEYSCHSCNIAHQRAYQQRTQSQSLELPTTEVAGFSGRSQLRHFLSANETLVQCQEVAKITELSPSSQRFDKTKSSLISQRIRQICHETFRRVLRGAEALHRGYFVPRSRHGRDGSHIQGSPTRARLDP